MTTYHRAHRDGPDAPPHVTDLRSALNRHVAQSFELHPTLFFHTRRITDNEDLQELIDRIRQPKKYASLECLHCDKKYARVSKNILNHWEDIHKAQLSKLHPGLQQELRQKKPTPAALRQLYKTTMQSDAEDADVADAVPDVVPAVPVSISPLPAPVTVAAAEPVQRNEESVQISASEKPNIADASEPRTRRRRKTSDNTQHTRVTRLRRSKQHDANEGYDKEEDADE